MFNPGDKVKRINGSWYNAIEGFVYTVKKESDKTVGGLFLKELGDYGYDPKNFVLIKSTNKQMEFDFET